MLRQLLASLAVLAALLGVLSLGGHFHPAADTLALGRPLLAGLCILGLLACRTAALRLLTGVIGLGLAVTIAIPFLPQAPGGDIRIYAKNLRYRNDALPALAADIRSAGVDVVMLQEVSDENSEILKLLKADFPHQTLCRFSTWSGVAIASRHPFDGDRRCTRGRAAAAAPIRLDGTRIWVVSAHIPWLWPYDSAEREASALALVKDLDGPVVVAGDFNAFPWTARVRRMAQESGTHLAGPVRPTFWYRGVPLPLDFAMAPGGGSVENRAMLGSDHAGIVADLALSAR